MSFYGLFLWCSVLLFLYVFKITQNTVTACAPLNLGFVLFLYISVISQLFSFFFLETLSGNFQNFGECKAPTRHADNNRMI